ncbi:MAG: acylphosphatase, partial [Longimicrobiales bacterium]
MATDETSRRRFRVDGRVQGVGFRAWACRTGLEHRLRGIVQNRDDGSVEVEAEGPASALDGFAAALRQGPRYARVDTIEELRPHNTPL